ncbi:MAG: hypothetical protein AABY64_13305 [Bdellovibrionota bacterium]
MKKYIFLAVMSLPVVGFTQNTAVDQDVDQELNQLYSQDGAQGASSGRGRLGGNSTVSVNTQVQVPQVQKQPLTVVQASPMTESRADQMRKMRQETELGTETKIVEKLEQSRMEDEKRRANALFGDKFNTSGAEQPQAQVIAPPPVQVIQAPKENTREIIREELSAAMKVEEETEATPIEQKYFAALVGITEIPDATNVRGNYSLGATFGTKFDNAYEVEGTFIASNLTMNPVYYSGMVAPNMDINAYTAAVAVKYLFFSGMVKPLLGGLAQYTYRTYTWNNSNSGYYGSSPYYGGGGGGYNNNDSKTNSHAIDLGLVVGADIDFNSKFSLGLDYRYLFNVSSQRNNNAFVYQPFYGRALETMNSYVMSLSAKVNF